MQEVPVPPQPDERSERLRKTFIAMKTAVDQALPDANDQIAVYTVGLVAAVAAFNAEAGLGRGALINAVCADFRRVLQRELPMGGPTGSSDD